MESFYTEEDSFEQELGEVLEEDDEEEDSTVIKKNSNNFIKFK